MNIVWFVFYSADPEGRRLSAVRGHRYLVPAAGGGHLEVSLGV